MTRDSDWKILVRAVLESVAYQSYDLFDSMKKEGIKPKIIKAKPEKQLTPLQQYRKENEAYKCMKQEYNELYTQKKKNETQLLNTIHKQKNIPKLVKSLNPMTKLWI